MTSMKKRVRYLMSFGILLSAFGVILACGNPTGSDLARTIFSGEKADTSGTSTTGSGYADDDGDDSGDGDGDGDGDGGVVLVDSWTATSTGDNCPIGREVHTAVWTGTSLIVWGGKNFDFYNDTGGVYDPATDTWTATSTGDNCPSARQNPVAVWTGSKMIVWGGKDEFDNYLNTGGVYDPATDTWTATSTGDNCPSGREYTVAVWTGSKMIVWGGDESDASFAVNTGGVYDPETDTWTATSTGDNCPGARLRHRAVWTGSAMIVWGGESNFDAYINTGGIYDPATDTWTATSTGGNCPDARSYHAVVWADMQMIVWGGRDSFTFFNTGGVYDPAVDSWTATSTGDNCPIGRAKHVAVWTGTQMIVWSGSGSAGLTKTGGVYDLTTDSWTATSTDGDCPDARADTSAFWTGTEMIVWGGDSRNTGGRYK